MSEPVVDLAFPLRGDTIPADHGYGLFGAISRHLPSIHGDTTMGVHPILGRLTGDRRLALTPFSRLVLRLSAARIPEALRLAGQHLDLDGSRCLVGVPTVHAIVSAAALSSRFVTVRGFTEPDSFLDALRRQLADLQVVGVPTIVTRRTTRSIEGRSNAESEPHIRRTLRIRDKQVVGFAVRVEQLTPAAAIRLQESGLGGRRRFGCGIFVPDARERSKDDGLRSPPR